MNGKLKLTSANGLHSLTTGSMPLVASRQAVGWPCRQFTMDSSPSKMRTMLVEAFSQMKNFPSSDPAATN